MMRIRTALHYFRIPTLDSPLFILDKGGTFWLYVLLFIRSAELHEDGNISGESLAEELVVAD